MRHGFLREFCLRNTKIILATPSDAFSTELPTKPSHTTTSVVPL